MGRNVSAYHGGPVPDIAVGTFRGIPLAPEDCPAPPCGPGRHRLHFVVADHPEYGRHCTRCTYTDTVPMPVLTSVRVSGTVSRADRHR